MDTNVATVMPLKRYIWLKQEEVHLPTKIYFLLSAHVQFPSKRNLSFVTRKKKSTKPKDGKWWLLKKPSKVFNGGMGGQTDNLTGKRGSQGSQTSSGNSKASFSKIYQV